MWGTITVCTGNTHVLLFVFLNICLSDIEIPYARSGDSCSGNKPVRLALLLVMQIVRLLRHQVSWLFVSRNTDRYSL
jgi:hypothetical protein